MLAPVVPVGTDRSGTLVLVVEDDADTLDGYVEFLESAGFNPVGQIDGAAALAFARNHIPDIVVTDLVMPTMDGFALAAALRDDERTRGVPVIALTAHWSRDLQRASVAAGIASMIAKPCMPAHLVEEIDRVVRRSQLMAAVLGAMDNCSLRSAAPSPHAGLRNAVARRGGQV